MEPILQRPDKLDLDEVQASGAQTLEVVYGLVQHRRRVIDGKKPVPNRCVSLTNDHPSGPRRQGFGRQGPTDSKCAFTHEN